MKLQQKFDAYLYNFIFWRFDTKWQNHEIISTSLPEYQMLLLEKAFSDPVLFFN